MGVIPWSPLAGRLAVGQLAQGRGGLAPMSPARKRLADRFDLSLPANQRKLEAAEALAQLAEEAGMSLIEMAIAFVIRHPRSRPRSSARGRWSSSNRQLPAADIELADDVLDRIDEIVAPGTNVNPADNGWVNPALEPAARRR